MHDFLNFIFSVLCLCSFIFVGEKGAWEGGEMDMRWEINSFSEFSQCSDVKMANLGRVISWFGSPFISWRALQDIKTGPWAQLFPQLASLSFHFGTVQGLRSTYLTHQCFADIANSPPPLFFLHHDFVHISFISCVCDVFSTLSRLTFSLKIMLGGRINSFRVSKPLLKCSEMPRHNQWLTRILSFLIERSNHMQLR